MNLYIGLESSWDAKCYPRVAEWPLCEDREARLFQQYTGMLLEAYTSDARWYEDAFCAGCRPSSFWGSRLYDSCQSVSLDGEEVPEEIYVIMGFHPEEITWPGEYDPYRLRIEVVWWKKRSPAFASREEAEKVLRECAEAKPDSRFAIATVPVKT